MGAFSGHRPVDGDYNVREAHVRIVHELLKWLSKSAAHGKHLVSGCAGPSSKAELSTCLLYTSDAADDM
eukprot:11705348-Alexandrium_andersonii.AAC.1